MIVEFSKSIVQDAWFARVSLDNGLVIAGFHFYECNNREEARLRFRKEACSYYQKAKEVFNDTEN